MDFIEDESKDLIPLSDDKQEIDNEKEEKINNEEEKEEGVKEEDVKDKKTLNLFNISCLYISEFFNSNIDYACNSVFLFTELILTKPYDYFNNNLNENKILIWFDENIFNIYISNLNNSIKFFVFFIIFSLIVNLIIQLFIFSLFLKINKFSYDLGIIQNLIEEHERTLNNLAKIGFNYIVENNCSMLET